MLTMAVAVAMPEQMHYGTDQQQHIRSGGPCMAGMVPEQVSADHCDCEHRS
jgi:hypothetical protein